MMSRLRGREGVQEIWRSVIKVSTQNSDMGEGGSPKRGRKFRRHLWMVPEPFNLRYSILAQSSPISIGLM